MKSTVAALVAGDFSVCLARFSSAIAGASFAVNEVGPGMLQIMRDPACPSLLLSIGVHGDETAPIELVAQLLESLAMQPDQLAVNLLLVVGNPAAIAQARRFVEADLNRLFKQEQGDLVATCEAVRARLIMQVSRQFFDAACGPRWHLDLHTTIRQSVYPTFAIMPDVIALPKKRALLNLLGHAGIGAVILNRSAAGTFSAFTAEHLGTTSATLELGRISALGSNDMTQFADAATALAALLRNGPITNTPTGLPDVFELAQEIIKMSDAFVLHFDAATPNFTSFAPGCIIASDDTLVHRVGTHEEHVVFPNPSVRIGQRAALMVVRGSLH